MSCLKSSANLVINGRKLLKMGQIAEGGYAYVDLAVDLDTCEQFALKTILCHTEKHVANVYHEIALLNEIVPHPNIVELYGCNFLEDEKSHYPKTFLLLFEYCDGGNLSHQILHGNRKFTTDEIICIFSDIALALHHLHSHDPPIYHRDIKLENVLLQSSTSLHKLCDFGSATAHAYDTSTMTRDQLLDLSAQIQKTTTHIYRAPEMADLYQKQVIDDKADIWMLGCVLYTLVFQKHPFDYQSPNLAITSAQFTLPIDQSRDVPRNVIDMIFWCLALNTHDRPSSKDLHDIIKKDLLSSEKHIESLLPQNVLQRRNHEFEKLAYMSSSLNDLISLQPKYTRKEDKSIDSKQIKPPPEFNTSWSFSSDCSHNQPIDFSFPPPNMDNSSTS